MKSFFPVTLIFFLVAIFSWQFLIKGLLPIPSDTIIGLYYPFRELYQKTNPNGIAYKNFLITDPVRQQIPWKNLSIVLEKESQLPLWNPYNFAGTPLLANFQSAVFYPLNLLFFVLPFPISWSVLVLLQPLLMGIFLFSYLDNLKLKKLASILGAITFSFSGFSIAWMEWGTILHTALWLPLILLSIDKIINHSQPSKIKWLAVFILSLTFSLLSGHLQTFFYLVLFSIAYFLVRWIQHGKNLKTLSTFLVLTFSVLVLTIIQWLPTLKFILLSARDVDLPDYSVLGWFVPWQNLIQFLAPDFFGNPATLNYWGIWNYAEFIGYVGIIPLIIAFFALFFRKDKKTLFFGVTFFLSLIFALPTFFAKLPFKFDLPFISTAQPTRLLFVTDFSLSVLAALGFDYFMVLKNKKTIFYILGIFSVLIVGLWSFVLLFHGSLVSLENLRVSKQNLILPTIIFVLSSVVILLIVFLKKDKFSKVVILLPYLLIIITIFDLFRFGWKFEPFTNKNYLFPSTSVISFLQKQNSKEPFRIMATDSKILPPNFSAMYKIQTLDGYDPLYLSRFGELMAAAGREVPDINPPFGFNRIITPQNYKSRIIALANVKYVLSLEEIRDANLNQVFSDKTVRVYENKQVLPRAFFAATGIIVNSKQESINAMFDVGYQLNYRAVVENVLPSEKSNFQSNWDQGKIEFIKYQENRVVIKTQNPGKGFLVITDSFYPSWHAKIDGIETKIYLTDYNFRGIITPKGEHTIEFYNILF